MTYHVGYLQIDEMHSAFVHICRQLVDSMCKSVEVVHKSHTVVHILPEVECLDMLSKTEPMPRQCGCVHLHT